MKAGPAIAADGTIYEGGMDGNLYAIAGSPGGLKWKFATGASILSSAAIGTDGTIYVGSNDFNLYAINPDGTQQWAVNTGSPVSSSPAIGADGTVYVGTVGGTLYAIGQPVVISDIAFSPGSSVTGGTNTTGAVTLAKPAPAGGVTVFLKSDNQLVVVPASVSVQAGATSATFSVSSTAVLAAVSANITAVSGGSPVKAVLTIEPPVPSAIVLSPSSIAGGSILSATITLSGPAPSGGLALSLSSSSTSTPVPATVTVPAGVSSATITISTTGVNSSTSSTITCTAGSSVSAARVTVLPAQISSVQLSPSTVTGGSLTTVNLSVLLTGQAGSNGGTVILSSSDPTDASVPVSVFVPAGASSAVAVVTHQVVTTAKTVTLTATYSDQQLSTTLNVEPFTVSSVALSSGSVIGGGVAVGTVTISGPPKGAGMVVKLSASSSAVRIPASVTIPVGAVTANFAVKTGRVTKSQTLSIVGKLGKSSDSASLTVSPISLAGLDCPSAMIGGASGTGTVTIVSVAPEGGVVVSLSSKKSNLVLPASVTVPSGATSATFKIGSTGSVRQ